MSNITVEHLGIKEVDALVLERQQKQSAQPKELQMSKETSDWFKAQMPEWSFVDKPRESDRITGYINKYAPHGQMIAVAIHNEIPFRAIKIIDD